MVSQLSCFWRMQHTVTQSSLNGKVPVGDFPHTRRWIKQGISSLPGFNWEENYLCLLWWFCLHQEPRRRAALLLSIIHGDNSRGRRGLPPIGWAESADLLANFYFALWGNDTVAGLCTQFGTWKLAEADARPQLMLITPHMHGNLNTGWVILLGAGN